MERKTVKATKAVSMVFPTYFAFLHAIIFFLNLLEKLSSAGNL